VATFQVNGLQLLRKILKPLGRNIKSPNDVLIWDFLIMKQGCQLLNLDSRFQVTCFVAVATKLPSIDPPQLFFLSILRAADSHHRRFAPAQRMTCHTNWRYEVVSVCDVDDLTTL
jgi:hypothetical protein